jgi:aminopeptidase N
MFQFIMRACWLVALILTGFAWADTYPRQTSIDAQHYVFRLTLSDDTDEIAGEASVTVRLLRPDVKEFSLDLASGMTVTSVISGSVNVPFTHQSDRLNITLAPAPGDLRTVTIHYHGIPAGGLRIGTNRYNDRTFNTDNWPNQARQWLPMIDHPYDKATSEFIITAPAKYLVVANGLLVEETELGDGRKLTHWKQSVPIASWLNAIAVAPFAARHFGMAAGVPLETWVYHQDRDKGIATFETPTREAMEFFNSAIGPYSYEKLADVEIPGLHGGAEHATAIFYGEDAVTDHAATNLVAHEIAHHWFGNSVTEKDWDDVWLSEGFATYFTLLNIEHYEGRDAFVTGLTRSRDAIFALQEKLPGVAIIHDNLSDMKKVTNALIYQKGAWTLHMLRGEMGDDKFWATIREYYRRYRNSNASTDDFRNVAEETSGMQLGWFFQQWLKRAGTPVIAASWHYDAQAHAVEIEVAQTQPGEVYRLPLEVVCSGKVEKLELVQRQQHFAIPADEEPKDVRLDPNTRVLVSAELHHAPQQYR